MTTTSTTSDESLDHDPATDPVSRLLIAIENGRPVDPAILDANIVLDATVPNWRIEVVGADRVREEFGRWFGDPGSFDSVVRLPVPGGEVVELDLTWVEDGVPHACHQAHLLQIEHGRIVRDTVFCGGRWPAPLLAEMEAARGC